MALEESIQNTDNDYVPTGIKRCGGLCTGTAWDNFDVNIETLSGLGTIHHTYGICYQNESSDVVTDEPSLRTTKKGKKKGFKKVHSAQQSELEPCRKRLKMADFNFEQDLEQLPSSYNRSKSIDTLWTLARAVNNESIPLWRGWNSQRLVDRCPKQIVGYMQHIQLPPTRVDVVKKTLKRSQSVSRECGEEVTLVTYDFAIAKIAKKIQSIELIEGSGGPFLLSECKIIAPGSMNKFLKGKMYNRCKRGHLLLSTAFQALHFRRFCKENEVDEDIISELKEWALGNSLVVSDGLQEIASQYQSYCAQTVKGELGRTAQFWMQYCMLIDLYLLLVRGVKTNDTMLFSYALYELSSLFFSTNHHKYARWMPRFAIELRDIKENKPALHKMLSKEGFSVRRGSGHFCRVGVDMALEQTINAEAKNRLKGIFGFADVQTAVNRWMCTNSIRSKIVNSILEIADMSPGNETKSNELKLYRIEKDAGDLTLLITSIRGTLNPFSNEISKELLYNIETGKRAEKEAEEYLLSCFEDGKKKRDAFVNKCIADGNRYEQPIKRVKIVNFCSQSFYEMNKSKKADSVAHAKGTRDLFGRLLFIATKSELTFSTIFSYPLVPYPPSMAHPDASLRSTKKSVVLDLVEKEITTMNPPCTNALIMDGMFLLQSLEKQLPHNLRGLVRAILMRAMKSSLERVDLVFDTYDSPTLKDIKRIERGNTDTIDTYSFGPIQKTPKNFHELLRLSSFKKSFLRFFYEEIKNQDYAPIIQNRILYCSVDNQCIRLCCNEQGLLSSEPVFELHGNPDEADTRIAFHIRHVSQNGFENIVVRANDTDILVILMANVQHFGNSHVWMDVGFDADNSRRYIDVNCAANSIEYVSPLVAVYALTRCDFVPAFFRKGKKKAVKLLKESDLFKETFSNFGDMELSENDMRVAEQFICCLYGYPKLHDINRARCAYFESKCKPKSLSKPLDYLKSVEPSMFPPCRPVVIEQIKRAWFVSRLYKWAYKDDPTRDFGWQLKNDRLEVKWFEGDQVPTTLEESEISNEDDSDDEIEEEEDEEDDLELDD